jgi:macrolide-specific efflux system membrane fusion protein
MKLKVVAILLLLVVGGAALVVATGGLPRSSAAAVTYLTAPAQMTDVSDDIAATGSVAASTAWDLAFGSATIASDPSASASSSSSTSTPTTSTDSDSWSVTDVKVKVGDVVTPKQVLATATNATLAADITAARKDVQGANLQLLNAQDSYDAATQTAQIRQAHSQLLSAQNAVAQAWTKYRDLQKTATHHELVAPAGGTVTAVNVTKGADAPSGAAITIDATTYQVSADVVETDVSKIQLGQAADVTVDAVNADLAGTVSAIAPTSESSSSSSSVVSYAVTIDLTSPPKELRSGMTANVTVTTASASNVLAVPAAALRGTDGNYSVLVLVDGVPQAQPVTVGLITSSLVEIKSGVNAGDNVVIGTSSDQRNATGGTGGFGGAGGFVVGGGAGGGGTRFGGRGPGN